MSRTAQATTNLTSCQTSTQFYVFYPLLKCWSLQTSSLWEQTVSVSKMCQTHFARRGMWTMTSKLSKQFTKRVQIWRILGISFLVCFFITFLINFGCIIKPQKKHWVCWSKTFGAFRGNCKTRSSCGESLTTFLFHILLCTPLLLFAQDAAMMCCEWPCQCGECCMLWRCVQMCVCTMVV